MVVVVWCDGQWPPAPFYTTPHPQATWTWGPDGHGAILLVNCDRDDPKAETPDNRDTAVRSYAGTGTSHTRNPTFLCFSPRIFLSYTPFFTPDLKDMSQMVLRTRGPHTIFAGHRLLLHVDFGDADKVGVFYGGSECPMPGFGGDRYPKLPAFNQNACSRASISSAARSLHPAGFI